MNTGENATGKCQRKFRKGMMNTQYNSHSASAINFHSEGYSPGVLETEVPKGCRGKAPTIGVRSPPKAETVCRHCLQILTAETIKISKLCTIHLLILDKYVSRRC